MKIEMINKNASFFLCQASVLQAKVALMFSAKEAYSDVDNLSPVCCWVSVDQK